ncbi:hypothetical protein H4V97_001386 [Flavobacterium sp. CG_23.5]|uniref:hypothetical protein n=1 Tax=Flavobacterium sp. CG_23.5 TaxID=2760708 RepID=UPI001AE846EC|nr:hypothetical protein [Flavobacterium sp. CG_23.5]MBP2283068.1 hypothetical protein [Flavobacterium sp. CG_23.5]
MKKIYLCLNTLICISFLVTLDSCTTDTSNLSSAAPNSFGSDKEINYYNSRKGDVMPANSENPYDTAGRVPTELSETNAAENSIIDSDGSIVHAPIAVNSLRGADYDPKLSGKATFINSDNRTNLFEVIATSNMSSTGKFILSDFIHSFQFLSKKEDRYVVLYDFVVKFERGILSNPLLTEMDKKIILTASSIVRCSSYASKTESIEAIDPDWTKLITHLIGETGSAD